MIDIDAKQLKRLVDYGYTDGHIAKKLGISKTSVWKCRHRSGILPHPDNRHPIRPDRFKAPNVDLLMADIQYEDDPKAIRDYGAGHLPFKPHPMTGGGSFQMILS